MTTLLQLVDEDTRAFNQIMDAFGLPKGNDEEKRLRTQAIQEATLHATQVPLQTMKTAYEAFDLCRAMAADGNPNSVSDSGVGALAVHAAVRGAWLNVKINAASLTDGPTAKALVAEADRLVAESYSQEKEIMEIVVSKI